MLTFAGQATDPEGDAITDRWNCGDNSTADGATATHRYPVRGGTSPC